MARTPVVSLALHQLAFKAGEQMRLSVTENLRAKRTFEVSDTSGAQWAQESDDGGTVTFTAAAAKSGSVTVKMTRTYDGTTASGSVDYTVTPTTRLLPGQVAGKTLIGMSTDDFQARMNELARPIGADHFFIGPGWDENKFVSKVQEALDRGLLPYGNMKTGSWAEFGGSKGDAMVESLGAKLAAFDVPMRVCFHHEPGFKTPNGAGEQGTGFQWRDMGIRQYPRLKRLVPKAVTGHVDNGFKWSPQTNGQGWEFSEIDQLYTDEFLAAVDVLGADYYDGATSKTSGEPAVVKVNRASEWMDRRGWTGQADIGEYNFVRPKDNDDMAAFLTAHADRWWCALAFNSDNNNRTGIPTVGAGWNLSHDYETPNDRRDAFRRMLDHPKTHP